MTTGGPPVLEIGALQTLGFCKQTAFGSPATVPANSANWVELRTRAIKPVIGRKLYKTFGGVRGDSRKRGRSKSNTGGTFSFALQNLQGVSLIAYAFGKDTISGAGPYVHVLDNSVSPPYFTLAINRSGQWYQVQDCQIDQLALALGGDDEWIITITILGGNGFTEIVAPTPTFATDIDELNLADLTAATLLDAVPVSDVEDFSFLLKNGVKQAWGGGSYYPTKQKEGEYDITGDVDLFFDEAAVEAMVQDMVVGTEVNAAFTVGGHALALANCNFLEPDWTDALAEFTRLKATYECRAPNACTWTITSPTLSTALV